MSGNISEGRITLKFSDILVRLIDIPSLSLLTTLFGLIVHDSTIVGLGLFSIHGFAVQRHFFGKTKDKFEERLKFVETQLTNVQYKVGMR